MSKCERESMESVGECVHEISGGGGGGILSLVTALSF